MSHPLQLADCGIELPDATGLLRRGGADLGDQVAYKLSLLNNAAHHLPGLDRLLCAALDLFDTVTESAFNNLSSAARRGDLPRGADAEG